MPRGSHTCKILHDATKVHTSDQGFNTQWELVLWACLVVRMKCCKLMPSLMPQTGFLELLLSVTFELCHAPFRWPYEVEDHGGEEVVDCVEVDLLYPHRVVVVVECH